MTMVDYEHIGVAIEFYADTCFFYSYFIFIGYSLLMLVVSKPDPTHLTH